MRSPLRIAFFITFSFIAFHSICEAGIKDWLAKKLPYKLPPEKLELDKLRPPTNVAVVDRNEEILFYLPSEKIHFYKPLAEISDTLQKFVVLSEDAKFFAHEGFDVEEIENSFKANLQSNKVKRGGSTITQQLAKNLFLDKKRSVTRKLFEVPWTLQLERDFTKKQILELYLNIIEWGPGLHGAEAASRHFFDKSAKDLTLRQALYLSLIVPNPPRFDVFAHPKTLEFIESKKRSFVERIYGEKKITDEERTELLKPGFEFASLDNSQRKFPLQHQGSYAGSWATLKAKWGPLAESLRKKAPANYANIKTSLLKTFDESNFDVPLVSSGTKVAPYLVFRDERGVADFKHLNKGQKISDDFALPSGLTLENAFSLDEVLYVAPPPPASSSLPNSAEPVEGG